MDWSSVSEKIVQDDQNKWDQKVSGEQLRVAETGNLEVVSNHVSDRTFLFKNANFVRVF